MSYSPIRTILNKATKTNNNLNIILFRENERIEYTLAQLENLNFYALNLRKNSNKKFWNEKISNLPLFLNFNFCFNIPPDIIPDLFLCLNNEDIKEASKFSHLYHIPIALLENKETKNHQNKI